MIRSAIPDDSKAIVDIYNYYILQSHSTFEMDPISSSEMQGRIESIQMEFNLPWLVLEIDREIVGYTYATQWKARAAYFKTVETTIYLDANAGGKGFGSQLYGALIDLLKNSGFHAIIGGIALPNDASVALHEKLGYEKVGLLKEVGYKFDRWVDVGYWQLLLDK